MRIALDGPSNEPHPPRSRAAEPINSPIGIMVLVTSQETPSQRSGMARVVLRAAVDRPFRTRLLREPHRAVAEVLGVEVPPTLRIKFVEKGSDLDLLIVLPDCVDDAAELALDDLDAVLGGTLPFFMEHAR